MLKVRKEIFASALSIFLIYLVLAGLAITGFRLIFPGSPPPLEYFSFSWRLLQGFLNFARLFPAIALSALVIPFGIKKQVHDKINPFSPKFLESLSLSIISAICGAVLYGFLSFLLVPLAHNHERSLIYQGRLYNHSKDIAYIHAENNNWNETAQFIYVCESIWPDNPELRSLVIETNIQLDSRRAMQDYYSIDTSDIDTSSPDFSGLLTPISAFELAEEALEEGRYFDAHWFATVGGRLSRPNSPETTRANQLASRAWSGVNSTDPDLLAPTSAQSEAHRLFRIKVNAYNALYSGDWITAYYTFLELGTLTPDDPDIPRLLSLSENGLKEIAFFLDEMEMSSGRVLNSAVFSLPLDSGRLVMRVYSLSSFSDSAYGMEMDLIAFDEMGQILWSLYAPYVKFLPSIINSRPSVLIYMRALDRNDISIRWEPSILNVSMENTFNDERTEFILPVSWDNFILLSNVNRGISYLSPIELNTAAINLADYGYPPELFMTELLQRFIRPVFFLPLGILCISIGWRYRALKKPRYMAVPMLFILPVVIFGMEHIARSWVNNIGIWTIINLGFAASIAIFGIGIIVSLIMSLIILASQHG